jgi:hypothetical protein|tara:strand:- start:4096 stop:4248 length:153 start_codon:yes stop_codon:yes gene_type:complete
MNRDDAMDVVIEAAACWLDDLCQMPCNERTDKEIATLNEAIEELMDVYCK